MISTSQLKMNLTDFVEKVNKEVQSRKTQGAAQSYLTYDAEKEIKALFAESVVAPSQFNDVGFDIRGSFGGPYYFSISAETVPMSDTEIDPVLRRLLADFQSMPTGPTDTVRVSSNFSWQADKFKQEKKVAEVVAQNVDFRLSATTKNPSPRLPHADTESHGIDITGFDEGIALHTYGGYTDYFKKLADLLRPNWALLEISAHDSKRIKENTSNLGKKLAALMEKAASVDMPRILAWRHRTQQLTAYALSRAFGAEFSPEQVGGTLVIPYKWVDSYEKILHLPLLDPGKNQKTKVDKVVRTYHSSRQRLPDLQNLLQAMEKAELDALFNHPLLTLSTARKYIEKELQAVCEVYSSGKERQTEDADIMLKRLIAEYYGDTPGEMASWSDEFRQSNPPDKFFGYLRSKGYGKAPQDAWTYSVDEFKTQLLSDFQQMRSQDQGKSVESYRKYFTNKSPTLEIKASVRVDGSEVGKIVAPEHGRFTWFSLDANPHGQPKWDYFSLLRFTGKEYVDFSIEVPLDIPPRLLAFQDKVCKKLGFDFK